MMSQVEIRRLKALSKSEACELLAQAFSDYPFAESYGLSPEATPKILEGSIDIMDAEDVWVYGIWKDARLVCISISVGRLPTLAKVRLYLRFTLSLSRLLKWRMVRFIRVMMERPKRKGEYLEFMSFGTLPSYQRQGFGRKMLHFVYEEAKKENYDGINLWTVRDRPAFLLYLKEGFQVEKEFTLFGGIPLCWMRKRFTDSI
ncbi:MAG: GNAT family N-acetyltransferase [Chloroflexi bacterium]|nr:GNAT family N-acetyltransferase [Chloroflexota bacterium]